MSAAVLGALAVLVLTAGGVRAQAGERRDWIETVVPRMASAEAQLGHARRLKREMNARTGDELAFWRQLAVEAYQAVRLFHPDARVAAVEGAFRAGEILRTAGDESGALAEFRWCIQHGERTEFRARGGLEVGHLHRRAERWREALEAYMAVAADASAASVRREDAWLWTGTAWKALERLDDARAAWTRVAEQGSDPLARIEAFDELALLLLERGDPEGAAGMLDRCLVTLSARALEETSEGERVRNALLRMRVVGALRRALAERKDSSASEGSSRTGLTR
jgi:tetratricopeptide (TPR) repeat protein